MAYHVHWHNHSRSGSLRQASLMVALAVAAAIALPAPVATRRSSQPPEASPTQASKTAPAAPVTVENKVRFKLQTFDLRDVRLLDGPFREAMVRDQQYLLSLDADRLLHNFRVNAGLPSTAKPLGGWEAPDVELRGHSVGHYLTACALMFRATGDARFKQRGDVIVFELAKAQRALAARGANVGYLSAFPEELIDRVETRQRVWAPYYTLHKIMAGLLDMAELADNAQALDVVTRMASWVRFRMDRLTVEQQQRMLGTEFGGMGEVLANLYAVTGNPDHLRVARMFDHKTLFDPLARGEDPLDGLHGNTQIPKMIAAAREYELTGESRYYDIARTFWQRVALNRSYVIGGNTDDESFFPVTDFARHLGSASAETCNTYNMLKLTRHLFQLAPSAEIMDFYERALFNHILPSQDPDTGMVMYYCPLKPGAFKTFSTPDDSFWCCVGTGMENHAKYADTIYAHDDRSLYVNLFLASELTWKTRGLRLRQETTFPEEEATRLTLTLDRPARFALMVRYPMWAQAGLTITVNDQAQAMAPATPGSYVALEREWKSGDVVRVKMPMAVHTEPLPGETKILAVMYGPLVLAADLGKDGLDQVKRYGPSVPQLGRVKTPAIPAFVGDVKDVVPSIKPVAGKRLTFTTSGPGRPAPVTLLPFNRIFASRYTVYWSVYSPAEWDARKSEVAATEARRQQVESATIDAIDVSNPASEAAHGLKAERSSTSEIEGRMYREARGGGFSYELKVVPDAPVLLACMFRGSEGRRRMFDILVDSEKVKTESLLYHPTEFFDMEYEVPAALTRGKTRITVRFQADATASTGALLELRTVRR